MEGPNGQILTYSDEILESWRVYCDNLYNEEDSDNSDASHETEDVEMEPVPLRSEVVTALKSLSTGKAAGRTKFQSSSSKKVRSIFEIRPIGAKSICVPILKKGTLGSIRIIVHSRRSLMPVKFLLFIFEGSDSRRSWSMSLRLNKPDSGDNEAPTTTLLPLRILMGKGQSKAKTTVLLLRWLSTSF